MDPLFNSIDSDNRSELKLMDLSCSSLSINSSNSEMSPPVSPFQRLRGTPLNMFASLEEFQRSSVYADLQDMVQASKKLIKRPDQSFDFDSEEGQKAAKVLLKQMERLCISFKVDTENRDYRNEFTQAYRVLYRPGSLCYLTEIIDSAQERIPYLWVNGEKYVFSSEVLEGGDKLYEAFLSLLQAFNFSEDLSADEIIQQVKTALRTVDRSWVKYEHMYVLELMVIEADARRFVRKAILAEREITELESVGLNCDEIRRRFIKLLGKMNSVANFEGNGRDDLNLDILIAAEELCGYNCPAVKALVDAVSNSYHKLRHLFKQYAISIEEVDPQLKNNIELVKLLEEFENSWGKGKAFLTNKKKCEQLVFFSGHLEQLAQKYTVLAEQIECRDAELFVTIPGLLVLLKVKGADKGLCKLFCPLIDQDGSQLQETFEKLRHLCKNTDLEQLERNIVGLEHGQFEESLKIIKMLGMEVQRNKPTQWNQFFNIAIPN